MENKCKDCNGEIGTAYSIGFDDGKRIAIKNIKDVAEVLTNCSRMRCNECQFKGMDWCRDELIEAMGKEVEKIAEWMD